MLEALNWHGDKRQLIENLPHLHSKLQLTDFLAIMQRLHFSHKLVHHINIEHIDPRQLPCLFINANDVCLLTINNNDEIIVKNSSGEIVDYQSIHNKSGSLCLFVHETSNKDTPLSTMPIIRENFTTSYKKVITLSIFKNPLMLATLFYIMAVYNKVIGTQSISMLIGLLVGIAIAFLGYVGLET